MKIFSILFLFLILISCQDNDPQIAEITVAMGEEFKLILNQSAIVYNPSVESNDTIGIVIIEINDYRCLEPACGWAGAAEVALTISDKKNTLNLDFCLGDCRLPRPGCFDYNLEDTIYFQLESIEYFGVLKDLSGEKLEDKVAILLFDRVHE